MTRIVIDANMSTQLHSLTQPVEVCDASGRLIGRFIPIIDMTEWEPVSSDISETELARRAASAEKRYTTQEVLGHLERL
jgi:hypothetical protein